MATYWQRTESMEKLKQSPICLPDDPEVLIFLFTYIQSG